MTFITTISGKKIDLLNPDPDSINIEDIAHALSYICRFNGHVQTHYSVAQHSINVCDLVENDKLTALLHDATEAYLGDVISPLKQLLPRYKKLEEKFWKVIAKKFNLPAIISNEIHIADKMILNMEISWYKTSYTNVAFSPLEAKERFLKRYNELRLV